MYYRPEEWDEIDERALDYIKSKGLLGIYDHCVKCMRDAWALTDKREDKTELDLSDSYAASATACEREAFGLYNALLIFARDDGRDDMAKLIYDWGHYSLFY